MSWFWGENEPAATVAADGVGSDVLVPKPTLRPAQASSDGEETGGGGHSATAEVAAAKLQADSTGAAQACHACFCLLGYAPAGSEPMQVDSDDAGVCFTVHRCTGTAARVEACMCVCSH